MGNFYYKLPERDEVVTLKLAWVCVSGAKENETPGGASLMSHDR